MQGVALVEMAIGEGRGVGLLGGDSGGLDKVLGDDHRVGGPGACGESHLPELGRRVVDGGLDVCRGDDVEVEGGDESAELGGKIVSGKTVGGLKFWRISWMKRK